MRSSFDEAMTRAKAAHTIKRACWQPGNHYRREYVCKCGAFVMATNWNQHILDAADQLLETASPNPEESKPS